MKKGRAGFYQGKYKISYPGKYLGQKAPIARSSWEFTFMAFLDNNANVSKWISEPPTMTIGYKLPDGSSHRYIPDFYVEMKTKSGRTKRFLIEVKPSKQSPYHSPPPKEPKRRTTKAIANWRQALKMYITNKLKWEAAEKYCKTKGIKFMVMTEIEMHIK